MTQLSRLSKLGCAKETTAGTYLAPTFWLPFQKGEVVDNYTMISDTSYRANDTVLQGVYQGVVHADWSIDLLGYPDIIGHALRGIVGPDTVTAGVSTTLSASTTIGATSISTAASIPVGSTIQIDTGTNIDYAVTGTPSGSGPYTIPITSPAVGLSKAHTSGATVVSQTLHTFKQSPGSARPTYSLLLWDTTQWQSYSYGVWSDVQIKIDPKAGVSLSTKLLSFPGVTQTSATPTYTAFDPFLGWEWNATTGGGTSTRGQTLDLTIKRASEAIHASDGIQSPREIFQGAIEVDGTYKAVFENNNDLGPYLANTQQPTIAQLTQPVAKGGCILTITMSQSAWKTGKRDFGSSYVQSDYSISGVYNSTDGGAVSVTLSNYQTTAY